jgi:hypothetical protein
VRLDGILVPVSSASATQVIDMLDRNFAVADFRTNLTGDPKRRTWSTATYVHTLGRHGIRADDRFGVMLTPAIDPHIPVDPSRIGTGLVVSVEQIVSPFNEWKKPGSQIGNEGFKSIVNLRLISSLETVATTGFIALFFFAVRWRFKRE